MIGFPHAIVIGIVASLIILCGLFLKRFSLIVGGMFLSLTTASPMVTFTRGVAGAIVPSDAVAIVLLFGLIFGGFRGMSSFVTPKWRKPFIILSVIWMLSILLVGSWNMPGLMEGRGYRVSSAIPFLTLNMQITVFRLLRAGLLMAFFLVISRLAIDNRGLQTIFWCFWVVTVCIAFAQILSKLGIVDLSLNSPYLSSQMDLKKGYILGFTKSAANRILVMGFFVSFILIYKSIIFKWFYAISAVLLVVSIFLSGSRSAILGMVVGTIILTFRANLKYLPLVLLFAVTTGLGGFFIISRWFPDALIPFQVFLQIGDRPETSRDLITDWTFNYLAGNPHVLLTGVGFMNYVYALEPLGAISAHAHNDFMTCVTEIGVIGLIVFVWWLSSLGKALWLTGRRAIGKERWISACVNAGFWGLLSTMLFEATLFPAGQSLSMNRLQIILFGTFTAYYIQKQAWEESSYLYHESSYGDQDGYYESGQEDYETDLEI